MKNPKNKSKKSGSMGRSTTARAAKKEVTGASEKAVASKKTSRARVADERARDEAAMTALAGAAAAGEKEAQAQLLAAIEPLIKKIVRVKFGGLGDHRAIGDMTPEDFAQEVRSAIIESVDRWMPTHSFAAWVNGVANKMFVSLLRYADVRKRGGDPATPAESAADLIESAADGGDPTIDRWTNRYSVRAVAAQRETLALTMAAVEKLDRRLARVFELLYVCGLGRAEAARRLKVSVRKLYELEQKLLAGVETNLPSKSRLAVRGLSSGPGEKIRRDGRRR